MNSWLSSTNAKEIGTLYLIFAVFAGMIGTAFSVLIRLELLAPVVQVLQGDHQLFNVIITAHAFIMISFFIFFIFLSIRNSLLTLHFLGYNYFLFLVLKNILKIVFKVFKYLSYFFKRGRFLILSATPFSILFQNVLEATNNAGPHNALVLAKPNVNQFGDALEKMAAALDNEPTSYEEAFPNFKPGDPIEIYPIKLLKICNEYTKDFMSDVLAMTIQKLQGRDVFGVFSQNLREQDDILPVTKALPKEIIEAISTSSEIVKSGKPLGSIGEMTLNQFVNDIFGPDLSQLLTFSNLVVGTAQLIALGYLYKQTINTFARHVYPMSALELMGDNKQAKLDCLIKRSTSIRNFSIFICPILVMGIYAKTQGRIDIIDSIKEKIEPLKKSLIFFITRQNIKTFNRNLSSSASNPNHNNKQNRYTLYGLLVCLLLYILTFFVNFKSILLFYIIATFIYFIFLAFELIIFLLFINKKFSMPSYLPDYIRNWFLSKEKIAQSDIEVIRSFLDLDIRNLLVFVLFLILLIVLYLYG